jgi:hypothetical protein
MSTGNSTSSRIGENLVAIGAMTMDQVNDVLGKQQAGDGRLFGEIAIELDYIDDEVLASYLEGKHSS